MMSTKQKILNKNIYVLPKVFESALADAWAFDDERSSRSERVKCYYLPKNEDAQEDCNNPLAHPHQALMESFSPPQALMESFSTWK